MNALILLTPPLLANLLIAGLVIPSILALVVFLACLLPPTLPIPFPPFPPFPYPAIMYYYYYVDSIGISLYI